MRGGTVVNIGRWAFVIGVLLSVIAGFFSIAYIMTVLAILGLIVGFLNVTDKESHNYLVAVIALLVIGTASIQALSTLGTLYGLTESIITNVIAFVGASGLVVALKEVLAMGKPE